MARVSADTMKTRTGTQPRGGRRPTSGNAAQRAAEPAEEPPVDEETAVAEDADADEPAADEPEAATAPTNGHSRATRTAPAATAEPAELTKDELLALGKLTRFALENGLSVEECAKRFRVMLDAFDKATGAL